ncbi:Presenilins-associated rhomboid-like protein, mitochondrial [Termitomyces sp. J132]|nr:Presenilins-associated rhomboid-like protein, mitochondrial [Termitomyces sp. J132]
MFKISLGRLHVKPVGSPYSWSSRSLYQSAVCSSFRVTSPRWQSMPSFREEVARTRPEESFADKFGKPRIGRHILFVFGGISSVFAYAAFYTNMETGTWTNRLMPATKSSWVSQSVTNADLRRAYRIELVKKWRGWFASITEEAQGIPKAIRPWIAAAYAAVLNPYGNSSEGKRLCWKICLFNAVVWLAWKVKRFEPKMNTRFMHNPLSGLTFTLLTSMFSHKSFLHLLANCLALEGFGSAAYLYLVKEQDKAAPAQLEVSASWHFLAFFVSAGLFSGLVSHVVATKFMYPRMVAKLSAPSTPVKANTWASAVAVSSAPAASVVKAAAPRPILPSLGASGAIYASVTLTALAFPDSQVSLIIPPSYPIDIQTGVGALVLLDIIGAARGWRFFDHWAHLGGAAFGVAYYCYGPELWKCMRRTFDSTVRTPITR